jgi:hypothetical protein
VDAVASIRLRQALATAEPAPLGRRHRFDLYPPCLVTVWATWKETRSAKWTILSLVLPLAIATVLTFVIYQGGRLLGF